MTNQIDLGRIYGIEGGVADASGLEPVNFLRSPNIPTLEQIAQYNLASRGIDVSPQIGNQSTVIPTDITPDYSMGLPYDTDIQNDPMVSTPTTVSNASMTMSAPTTDVNQVGNVAITDFSNPYPVTAESIQYLNGFIRTQIGRRITVTFLVGSNLIEEKTGYLLGVGANYILINELDTNDLTACDFYNIKFIRFYY